MCYIKQNYLWLQQHAQDAIIAIKGVTIKYTVVTGIYLDALDNVVIQLNPTTNHATALRNLYSSNATRNVVTPKNISGSRLNAIIRQIEIERITPRNLEWSLHLCSIAEFSRMAHSYADKKEFIILTAEIYEIDPKGIIIYACEVCETELDKLSKEKWCKQCKKYPKILIKSKFYITITDATDGSIKIMCFDNSLETIFGHTLENLIEMLDYEPAEYQQVIQKPIGKTFYFRVKVVKNKHYQRSLFFFCSIVEQIDTELEQQRKRNYNSVIFFSIFYIFTSF
jgi:hypothetical protein